MNEYKCNECGKVSTEKEWNNTTQNEFKNIKIVPLNNDTDIYAHSYICPKCEERIDAYFLEKQ